jgi:hypothetical protein
MMAKATGNRSLLLTSLLRLEKIINEELKA